jgi:hypothetical protein
MLKIERGKYSYNISLALEKIQIENEIKSSSIWIILEMRTRTSYSVSESL